MVDIELMFQLAEKAKGSIVAPEASQLANNDCKRCSASLVALDLWTCVACGLTADTVISSSEEGFAGLEGSRVERVDQQSHFSASLQLTTKNSFRPGSRQWRTQNISNSAGRTATDVNLLKVFETLRMYCERLNLSDEVVALAKDIYKMYRDRLVEKNGTKHRGNKLKSIHAWIIWFASAKTGRIISKAEAKAALGIKGKVDIFTEKEKREVILLGPPWIREVSQGVELTPSSLINCSSLPLGQRDKFELKTYAEWIQSHQNYHLIASKMKPHSIAAGIALFKYPELKSQILSSFGVSLQVTQRAVAQIKKIK